MFNDRMLFLFFKIFWLKDKILREWFVLECSTRKLWHLVQKQREVWKGKKGGREAEYSVYVWAKWVEAQDSEKSVSEKLQTVTERYVCRVRLLTTQKPVNRPGWWKGKFALFQMPATGGEGGRHLSKGWLSPSPDKQGVRDFTDKSSGRLHAEASQSSLTVIFNWSSVVWLASSWLF